MNNHSLASFSKMERSIFDVDNLRQKIKSVEMELKNLKWLLKQAEASLCADNTSYPCPESEMEISEWRWPLAECEYKRYGRQMIISQIGIKGRSYHRILTSTKIFRSTQIKECISPYCRRWWIRLSSSSIFSWYRNRHHRIS